MNNVQEHTKGFLKGSLPNWFSVILLAMIAYFCKRTMEDFDGLRSRVSETRERIISAEMQIKTLESGLVDLRVSQRDIISELRQINTKLQK